MLSKRPGSRPKPATVGAFRYSKRTSQSAAAHVHRPNREPQRADGQCCHTTVSTLDHTMSDPASSDAAQLAFTFNFTAPPAAASASAPVEPFVMNAPTAAATTAAPFSLATSFAGFSIGADMNATPARVPMSERIAQEQMEAMRDAAAAFATATFAAPATPAAPSFAAPASFTAFPAASVVTASVGDGADAVVNPFTNPFAKPAMPSSAAFASPSAAKRVPPSSGACDVTSPLTQAAPAPAVVFPPAPVPVDLTKQYAVILNLEQKILDLVALACESTFMDPTYGAVLQKIKHHFFHREFEKVFGDPKHLGVYVAQYLPMRALCYESMWSTQPLLKKLLEKDITIYSIGAGPGSEAVGISMAREQSLRQRIRDGRLTLADATRASTPPRFRIHTQDLFDWTPPLTAVFDSLARHAPISYGTTNFTVSQSNVLDAQLKTAQFRNSHVVTMMFVLNELFQENKSATMHFLDRLITAMRPGAFLIVADSAGDFSQLEIGKQQQEATTTPPADGKEAAATTPDQSPESATDAQEGGGASDAGRGAELESEEEDEEEESDASTGASASAASAKNGSSAAAAAAAPKEAAKPRRRYWIYSLLDAIPALSTLHACDSQWYRYPEKEKSLKYPLRFENMRYFLRIYQKKA